MTFVTDEPVAWLWRSVPKWSMDNGDGGIEADEADAREAAEHAMDDPGMISAIVIPVGLVLGKWKALAQPAIALRSTTRGVRWLDNDYHGIGVAYLAAGQ
jgi:hypothetical protein